MSNTFFTSDLHLGHANILEFEAASRPFNTIEEMNETIIDRWNNVVTQSDKVYVLGDVVFGKKNLPLLGRLNGQKRLILGNHDQYPIEEYLKYFKSVYGVRFWNDCILTHVPVHPSQLEHRSKYNICGHLHSKSVLLDNGTIDTRYKISCLEHWNLMPVSADELFK